MWVGEEGVAKLRDDMAEIGFEGPAGAYIFFRIFFRVSSVMHVDEKLGPSRPAGREVLAFLGGPCTFF